MADDSQTPPTNDAQQSAEQKLGKHGVTLWRTMNPVTGQPLKNPFPVKINQNGYQVPKGADLSEYAEALGPMAFLLEMGELARTNPDFAKSLPPTSWIAPGFIPASTLTVLVGPPGSGKTSVLVHALFQASVQHQVIYFHPDAGDNDVRHFGPLPLQNKDALFYYCALGYGTQSFTPGQLAASILSMPYTFRHCEERELTGAVLVVDTLSTIVDVNADGELRAMLMAMNEVKKATGLAFVLVAHTNKHKIEDRNVFRGSGELLNHCDNLIYLDYLEDQCNEREQVLTTRTDPRLGAKARTPGIDRTFAINRQTREVSDIDLLSPEELKGRDAVLELLRESEIGCVARPSVVAYLKQQCDMGRDRADQLIQKGAEISAWILERGPDNRLLLVLPSHASVR